MLLRQKKERMSKAGFLSLIVLIIASLCLGFAPVEKDKTKKITYMDGSRSFKMSSIGASRPLKLARDQWEKFTSSYGSEWKVDWNEETGTPRRISGGKIKTALTTTASDAEVESWAKKFVTLHRELFGIRAEELRLVDLRRAEGRLYVMFQQVYKDLTVYNSALKLTFNQAGELVLIANNCYPAIQCNLEARLSPEIAAQLAAERISSKQQNHGQSVEYILKDVQKVIFPMPSGREEPYRLCYLMKIHLDVPLGDWMVVMDADSGVEYVRYNNYRFGTVSGNVTAKILPAYYNDVPVTVGLKNEDIHLFALTPVYSWNMDTNPGWTTSYWQWGVPTGGGGSGGDLGPTSGYTGTRVYAYRLTGGYENNITSTRYLTTSAINCTGLSGTHLSFWQWLGIDYADYDKVRLQVSTDGVQWTTLWQNLSSLRKPGTSWERVVYDISAIADGQPTVYIRWGLGPTNSSTSFCGWFIDDVEIYANGGTSTTSATGDYTLSYAGSDSMNIYAGMSGPFAEIYYEDGRRLKYEKIVPSGTHNWCWIIPQLTRVMFWDLSSNPGWSVQEGWAFGVPLGNAGDPASGYTGSNVYGYNLAGAYANNITTTYYLKTAAIDCSAFKGTHLRFWRWLGVEYFDYATIDVSNDNSRWTNVYLNMGYPADVDTAWTQVTYDISAVADGRSAVYIRWGMGPTDSTVTYCGWNIDDVEILADNSSSDIKPGVYDYDEVNLFYHMNVAHSHIKSIDGGFSRMDYKVPGIVRFGTQYANAFSDGEGIYFGEGDNVSLRNTALFSDVIYHEYTHGVTNKIYPAPMLPYVGESGAMDEGWSDYFACTITNEPLIGEGDLVIGEPYLRTLDNNLRMPDDWYGEVHEDGQIIGGAMWDLRKALGAATADRLIHFARYNRAENFLDYYEDILITDDNNGNLNDGTPNMSAIANAFGKHGIGGLVIQNLRSDATSELVKNGKLDAGEKGNLRTTLKAYCLASNVQARLTSSDPYVIVEDGNSSYGSLGYGQEKDNSTDPFKISIHRSCPEDEILDLTLNITADDYVSYSREVKLINAPDQIVYDDGIPNMYFGYGAAGGKFAVRFTPFTYPLKFTAIRLWPHSLSAGVTITLNIWDDNGPGGKPGTVLMARTVTVSGKNTWEEFTIPGGGLTVTSGDIYIGWTEGSQVYYNGVTTKNSDKRSWVYDTSYGWLQLDEEGYFMDMLVRARVSLEGLYATAGSSWQIYE